MHGRIRPTWPARAFATHSGVGEHAPADGDEVGLARLERPLGEAGQADPSGDDHRHVDELLHGLGEPEREALVPARVLDVAPALPGRDRQVVDGRRLLERVDDLERVVERQPAGRVLVGAEPDADGEVGPAAGADLLDDLDEEARPPLGRVAAVGVEAPVRLRREELRDEVAVRRVDLGAVDPRRGVVGGGAAERLDDLADVGVRHLARDGRVARRGDRRRRERHSPPSGRRAPRGRGG